MTTFDARVIGRGRAGGALAEALRARDWRIDGPLGRGSDAHDAASDCRFLVLAVPDPVISELAAEIEPGDAVVLHLAGSLGLDVLEPHPRRASVHPLVALPDAARGAARLPGAWFAHAGDSAARALPEVLGGRIFEVPDQHRARYHATAAVAANHLVALLGQVERLAASIDVPFEAYLELARGAFDHVEAVGPEAALTGPVARDDWETVARHLAALPEDERPAYAVLAEAARILASSGAVA